VNQRQIETPTQQLIEEAIDAGDAGEAKRLLHLMVGDWERNKDYSINWITSLLSFIGRRLGEPAVEEALRDFGERYLKARRATGADARKRMEGIVRGMKANGAAVRFEDEGERYVLRFRCGSGGMLIDEGAYGPPKEYVTLRARGPVTFGREELPVYCAHCSVNNEIQAIEWDRRLPMVQFPPAKPGERCVHWVWKEGADVPEEYFERLGKKKPK
jgi:hypothetical protein